MEQKNSSQEQNYQSTIFGIILLFVVVNLAISSVLYMYHVNAQKAALLTEISNKSRAIGSSIEDLIEHSIELGIPLENIQGKKSYLQNKLKQAKEISYLVLTDEKGNILSKTDDVRDSLTGSFKRFAQSTVSINDKMEPFQIYSDYNIPLCINEGNHIVGFLHVGISSKLIQNNISSVFYDILVILLASLVIGYEFLNYFFMNAIVHPLRNLVRGLQSTSLRDFSSINQITMRDTISLMSERINQVIINLNTSLLSFKKRQDNLSSHNLYVDLVAEKTKETDVNFKWANGIPETVPPLPIITNLRLLGFLIIFSEAVLIPLLPSYAAQFYETTFYFSKQVTSSLPVTFFMIFALLSIPLSSVISNRIGFRKTFFVGYGLIALGYMLVFMGDSLLLLLVSRSVTAVGFSVSYICFQNYVSAYATDEEKLRSYAIFSVAIGSAYICGAPLGGLLVDNIGLKYTFLLATLAAIAAILITNKYIFDLKRKETDEKLVPGKAWYLFKQPEIAISVICSGLPMRLLHASLICFLYPLYLQHLGNSQSAVGRSMMVFGISMFIISPFAPRLVDKLSGSPWIVIISSFLMGSVMMMDRFFQSTESVLIGLAVYAIGSVVHVSAMMALLESWGTRHQDQYTKSTVLNFYFIFERIGMICGPIITSILLAKSSYSQTLFIMGLSILILNALYALYHVFKSKKLQRTIR